MAKKPDTPCATCGALLWAGRGSLPTGERTCRRCRSGRSAALAAGRAERRRARRAAQPPRPRRLCDCGAATGSAWRPRCPNCSATHRRASWQRKNAVRRGASPLGPLISVAQLGARDGWRCGICRRKVDPTLPYQHRMAGTRDHLVPVAEGGDDSRANLRLAHRSCNSRRGVRGTVQLALVG